MPHRHKHRRRQYFREEAKARKSMSPSAFDRSSGKIWKKKLKLEPSEFYSRSKMCFNAYFVWFTNKSTCLFDYKSNFFSYDCCDFIRWFFFKFVNLIFIIFVGDDIRKQIQDIIDELQNVKSQSRSNERRACMTQLIRLTRDGNSSIIKEKFR